MILYMFEFDFLVVGELEQPNGYCASTGDKSQDYRHRRNGNGQRLSPQQGQVRVSILAF